MTGHTTSPTQDTGPGYAASVLAEVLQQQPDVVADLIEQGDELDSPLVVTNTVNGTGDVRILYCNSAFAEMCGYEREKLVGASPRMLQGPETDGTAAESFVKELDKQGRAGTVLLNYKADGTPYYVEIMALRCPAPETLDSPDDELFVAFERSLGDLEPGGERELSRSYRLALLFESVMRRYLQRNYHRGMHPAQWSALRYFSLAAPDKRTLTDFARSHHTTMGTASTTVSTLAGKGYLIKRGFRGPIEVTEEGRALLSDDPLEEIAETLAALDADGTQWAERILLNMSERLDLRAAQDAN